MADGSLSTILGDTRVARAMRRSDAKVVALAEP